VARLRARQERDRQQCAVSPATFIARHCTIEDPAGNVLRFILWAFQLATLDAIHDDGRVIVLKARRLGLSWLVLAYALWLAIFQQGARVFILCKNEGDAAKLLDRVRRMRDRIAKAPGSYHLLEGLPAGSKSRDAVTALDVGLSSINALVATPAAARQETAALFVLDEFAFARDAEGIWQAVLPTVEGGGRLAVVSTGNGTTGRGAEFAKQWSRALAGESGFKPLFWPWDAEPRRDEAWKAREVAALGSAERFRVEYPETPDDAFVMPDAVNVLPLAGIDAAERLGREWRGKIPMPLGGAVHFGIDWGESTQAYVIWPLERGGIYVPPCEVVARHSEPGESTTAMLERYKNCPAPAGQRERPPLGEARYDAAGIQSMRTFRVVARRSYPQLKTVSIPFGAPVQGGARTFKEETIGYLRRLFRRAADGHTTQVIAIDPANVELLRQLRKWLLADDDSGRVEKGDDHGPDALIAGAAPIARRFRQLAEA
jgi:hypothetical protein